MRKIFIVLFSLLRYFCYGQKTIDSYPAFPGTTISDSDHIFGYHVNANGSKTTYDYDLSNLIFSDTVNIVGVTRPTLDSGLATRMNALEVSTVLHTSTATPNTITRLCDSSEYVSVITLPNNPPDKTINVLALVCKIYPSCVAVFKCAGGQKINLRSGSVTTDTLKILGETVWLQYHRADSTWIRMANELPLPEVKNLINAYNPVTMVQAATTASVSATYDTGFAGVGATLTGTANAHLIVDGYSVNVGDPILFKNQASSIQNGVYVITQVGTSSISPFIAVRAANYNSPANINNTVPMVVLNGSTLAKSIWADSTAVTAVGVDPLIFVRVGGNTIDAALQAGNSSKRTYFFGLDKKCDLGVQASTGSGEIYIQDSTNTFNTRYFWATKTGGYWMAEVVYDANFTVMKAQHGFGYVEVHDSDGEIICEKFAGLRPDIRAQINIGPLATANTILAFPFQDSVKQVTVNVPYKGVSGTQTWMLTALDTLHSPCAAGYELMTKYDVPSAQHTIFTPVTTGTVTLVNGRTNIINPAGTIAALTINPPASPANNDAFIIKFTQNVSAITYDASIVGGPTSAVQGTSAVFVYDSGAGKWY